MRIFVIAVTVLILWVIGRILLNLLNAGHWWIMPPFLVLVFAFGYFVAEDHEREEFHALGRRLIGRSRNRQ